jgi:hypothetical protein
MARWGVVGVVFEQVPIDLSGLNPWEHDWHQIDAEPIELPHPQHSEQLHRMWLYEIEGSGKRVLFAAGELSANVWGFYTPIG